MTGTQTPEPNLFIKRRRKARSVQKRRRTTSDDTSSPTQSPQHANDSLNARSSSARTKSRFQAKLKQAPLVPGYDQAVNDPETKQTSYSLENLRQLKDQLRIKPFSQERHVQEAKPKDKVIQNRQPSQDINVTREALVNTGETTKTSKPYEQCSSLPQSAPKREEKHMPGTVKAQPFSSAWNAGVYDDDDIEIEPVSNIPAKDDEAGGSESGEEEWEAQLMRRGGLKHGGDEKAMLRREIRLVRDAEEEGMQSGLHKKLKLDIQRQVDSLAGRQAFVEQKITRLEEVIKQNHRIDGVVTEKVDDIRRKVELYERLVECVSTASRTAADNADVIEGLGSKVDAEMKQEITEKMIGLIGGTDQFGRHREGHLRGIEELQEGFVDWGGRLIREIGDEAREFQERLQLSQMIKVMNEWHERYPSEYNSTCADRALGKLFGSVAVIQNDMNWICDLSGEVTDANHIARREQMIPNVVLGFGIKRFATWIRARWEPRLQESCEYVGKVIGCVTGAVTGATEVIQKALEERFLSEIRACGTLNSDDVRLALKGAILLAKRTQIDAGLLQGVDACEAICGLEDMTKDVEWIISFPYLRGDREKAQQRFLSQMVCIEAK